MWSALINTDKTFNKIQHHDKTLSKERIEGNFLNVIKDMF